MLSIKLSFVQRLLATRPTTGSSLAVVSRFAILGRLTGALLQAEQPDDMSQRCWRLRRQTLAARAQDLANDGRCALRRSSSIGRQQSTEWPRAPPVRSINSMKNCSRTSALNSGNVRRVMSSEARANSADSSKPRSSTEPPGSFRRKVAPRTRRFAQPAHAESAISARRSGSAPIAREAGFSPPCATGSADSGSMPDAACKRASHRSTGTSVSAKASLAACAMHRAQRQSGATCFSCSARNGLSGDTGLRFLRHLARERSNRRHQRICVGEQLVLQPQRMQLLQAIPPRAALTSARTDGCANVR